MEQRYKTALELIKRYIEVEDFPNKNTIKAMCETALLVPIPAEPLAVAGELTFSNVGTEEDEGDSDE